VIEPPTTKPTVEAPKLEPRVETPKLGPKLGEAPKLGPKVGGLARGLGTEAALAGFGVLLDFAFLAAWLIDEFIIAPFFERIERAMAEAYARSLTEKANAEFQSTIVPEIWRHNNCARAELRKFEAANQKAYVNLTLKLVYADKSSVAERAERWVTKEPLTDIFKLSFVKLKLESIGLSDKPAQRSVGKLKDSDEESGDGPTLEQSYTVSIDAPTVAQLEAKFGAADPAPAACCFIATACYGSAFAPEVVALQRLRDQGLMQTPAGRRAVLAYYRLSPPIAEWLKRHPRWCRVVRVMAIAPLARLAARRYPSASERAISDALEAIGSRSGRQRAWRWFRTAQATQQTRSKVHPS
jgi:hypothetical protein